MKTRAFPVRSPPDLARNFLVGCLITIWNIECNGTEADTSHVTATALIKSADLIPLYRVWSKHCYLRGGAAGPAPIKRTGRSGGRLSNTGLQGAAAPGVTKTAKPKFNFSKARDAACVVTLALVSRVSFSVSYKPVLPSITECCRRFRGLFEPQHKRWIFGMHLYDQLLAALVEVQKKAGKDPKAQIRLDPIPDSIRTLLTGPVAANQTEVQALFATIPAALRDSLMPFQRAGVEFALGKGGRVLIGDEMGCAPQPHPPSPAPRRGAVARAERVAPLVSLALREAGIGRPGRLPLTPPPPPPHDRSRRA